MLWVIVGIIAIVAVGIFATITTLRQSRRIRTRQPYRLASPSFSLSLITNTDHVRQRVPLISEVEADYTRLRYLLRSQQYREADWETYRMVLQVAQREREGWLRHTDIDDFPSADLCTIDRLWVKYSGGHFGFSVQKQIYQSLGGTREYREELWQTFGDRVGWRVRDNWLSYAQLTFVLQAPQGHMPVAAGVWVGGVPRVVGWGHGRYLLSRPDL